MKQEWRVDRENRAKNRRAAGVPAGLRSTGAERFADGRRVRLGEEPTDTAVQRVVRTALPTAILVVVHGSVRTAPAHSS